MLANPGAGRVVRPCLGLQGRAIDAGLANVIRMPVTAGYLVEVVYDGEPGGAVTEFRLVLPRTSLSGKTAGN